jgi:hypothetical protein
MGCDASSFDDIPMEWLNLFARMQLTKAEVRRLSELHLEYQTSKRSKIDIVEWLTMIDLERTNLTERIFWIADRDGDGYLNLYEFIVATWKVCILGDHSLGTNGLEEQIVNH